MSSRVAPLPVSAEQCRRWRTSCAAFARKARDEGKERMVRFWIKQARLWNHALVRAVRR